MAWEYTTAGVLWRLLPAKQGVFVLEDRNVEAKNVTFACVDMRTGAVRWRDVALEERWWVGIELVERDAVILHGYGAPDLPDHRGIYLLDLQSGALLWQHAELALLFVHDGRLCARKEEFDRQRFFEVALDSGTILREIDAPELDALRPKAPERAEDLVTFPQPFVDLRQLEGRLRPIAAKMAGGGAQGLVEVIRRGEFEAIAVHAGATGADPARPAYTQRLAVRHRDRTVFEDVMNTNAAVSAPDGFFAAGDMIYYIKDQRILRALHLHGS